MSDYKFNMPWPPTVNHYHQPAIVNGRPRIIKGAKARKYAKDAADHLKSIGIGGELISERLSVSLAIHPSTLAKYDIDNRTKGVFDALSNVGFWLDDEQVDRLTIIKSEKIKGGLVTISITKA